MWILEGAPSGIERIATAILSKSESDFLVPSRIAAELTPKLRTYLGIVALDTEGLEALLDRHRDAIAQLEPTASEREAFLQTQLSDSLLRRLPIHVRSDGAIGDAENVFREADWPIPAALREHVRTIQPCSSPLARERQQRLITAWSPQSQCLGRSFRHLRPTQTARRGRRKAPPEAGVFATPFRRRSAAAECDSRRQDEV